MSFVFMDASVLCKALWCSSLCSQKMSTVLARAGAAQTVRENDRDCHVHVTVHYTKYGVATAWATAWPCSGTGGPVWLSVPDSRVICNRNNPSIARPYTHPVLALHPLRVVSENCKAPSSPNTSCFS